MNRWQTALGFYQNPQTAHAVVNKLRRQGLKRVALIQRAHEGQLSFNVYTPSHWLILATLGFVALFALIGALKPDYFSALAPLFVVGLALFILYWLIAYYRFRIDETCLSRYAEWVIRDEALVIVQIHSAQVPIALKLLRHVESGHPLSFLLRSPEYERPDQENEEIIKEPLTAEQLETSAYQLASTLDRVALIRSRDHPLIKRLDKASHILAEIRHNVAEAEFVEQTITASAEWLLDNTHVIQGTIEEVRRNLPQKYYRDLLKMKEGPSTGLPRIYMIAKDIIQGMANRLSRESLIAYLNSYQQREPLTIGELWALPLMLRIKLIENLQCLAIDIDRRLCEEEQASFWGNRLLNVARREPGRLPQFLNDLALEKPRPSTHFAEELIEHLYDEETILPVVRKWLEDKLGASIAEIIQKEQKQQVAEQVAFSSAVISLITLSQLSWREIFEIINPIDAILQNDPTGSYSQMEFATRDHYRHAIEKIARFSLKKENEVALATLQMAQLGQDEATRHVGYYLIDKGRPDLEKRVGCQPSFVQQFRRGLHRHAAIIYLGSIALLTFGSALAVFALQSDSRHALLFTLLALIPISELIIQLVNTLFTQVLPPFILPKMFYEKGIPEELKTLLVVPVMLSNQKEIEEHIQRLEVTYLANLDSGLRFGLFFDFLDAQQAEMPEDQPLLEVAQKGLQALNEKYGSDTFALFLRKRVWSQSEHGWIGWERKRGKLECLNRFLIDATYSGVEVRVGSRAALNNVRYVITLDADTQLPKDTAKKLIEAISHPLNVPQISPEGRITRGYTIIQPRVSTHFAHARQSQFARLFSDVSSVDPYTQAVSDVYQDLTYEGSYHGKGIYDIQAFHRILSGRFPEERLLSHDLIEGCYARVAFATDICLLDQFPADYLTWCRRQHRWIRGDWQITDWLFDRSLSAINRWKIFDNLRRALLPISLTVLLLVAWLFSDHAWIWTGLAALVLLIPILLQFVCQVVAHPRSLKLAVRELGLGFLRALFNGALMLHYAILSLDALIRVLFRRLISHRHLLEWSTNKSCSSSTQHQFLIKLFLLSLFSIALLFIVAFVNPAAFTAALPFGVLWTLSPLLVVILDRSYLAEPSDRLSEDDRLFLRQVARRTWRYFDEFVGPSSNWLPPDNYQAALLVEVAQRTSPTNIGLWTLSALAAYDLKYITTDAIVDRVLRTFQTLTKLETYEGHLLNWYDTQSLRPLYPRYVSTVDSGNFLASLWTLEQGFLQMISEPLLPSSLLEGLRDTLELVNGDSDYHQKLSPLKDRLVNGASDPLSLITSIRSSLAFLQDFFIQNHPNSNAIPYGLTQLQKELEEWNTLITRYFSWVEILHEIEPTAIPRLSLQMLATAELPESLDRRLKSLPQEAPLTKRLLESLHTAQWLAGEKMGQIREIITLAQMVGERMNMQFLYNSERKLFSIGYHVEDRKLDSSHYDLLASEARIASLVAIARGDVPVEHWWSLGRSYRVLFRRQVLLSWGGSMFEYMMPLLFNQAYPESLIGAACEAAVSCQILYGKKRGIPWGISEAAFSEIDIRRTYQYRSFGVPGLGFKRGLEEDLVVSPYSSALALAVKPVAAVKNLRNMAFGPLKLLSDFGFYESIDFTRQRGPHGERGVIVYAFMAHHEGMSLLAFDNILNPNIMSKRFHADPRIAGVESLLYERIPFNPPIAKGSRKEIPISRLTPFSTIPIMGVVDTPHSAAPKVNLLSNGDYSLMLTNAGGGYSRWKEFDISRWRADTTCDDWGCFCYIKDLDTGAIWSTAYHPTWNKGRKYTVSFKADKVEYRRRDHSFETVTEIVVSPEDNAEVRLLTLANLSHEPHTLELTSYMELALAPHAADRAHPCFNKLFIETEALPELGALLAFRRLRSPNDTPLFAAHLVTASEPSLQPLQYETDRVAFIGRGKGLRHPVALDQNLSNSAGSVLDPIFSLRYRVALQPGQRVQIAFITAIADQREKAMALIKKYGDLAASHRALEMAWTHTQLELRHLRIHQEEAQLFQKLASRVLFPHAQLRPSHNRLCMNKRGQSCLWAYGISGDLPMVVATIADIHETDLIKQLLTAHAFWHMRGLKVDLIILNDEVTSYEHPLFELLTRLVNSHAHHTEIGKPGGVYLINSDQIPEEDHLLILSVAHVTLVAARGSLRQQVVSPMELTTYPSRLIVDKTILEEPSKPLPFLELSYFNGLGGFTPDGREYVIYLGADAQTPAPWINVIANPQFGTLVSEAGLGTTWYGNSQSNRLTPWSNDPLLNPIADAIYIRDDELGTYWTATPGPIRELDAYRIRHGQGYSRFEHNSHGIEQNLHIFVPVDDAGGVPLRIQRLQLRNGSSRRRFLTVTAYSEWVLGGDREQTQMHLITEWDPESQSLFAYNRYHPDFGSHLAFACSDPLPSSFTGSRMEFLGRNSQLSHPAALKRKNLAGLTGSASDPCAALQVQVELAPGEEKELLFILGYAKDSETARQLILKCREKGWVEQCFKETQEWWNTLLGTIQIDVPDPSLKFLFNRWLLYQNLSCRYWGRSAFYQSGGAYGFRDQLQDMLAMVYTAPQMAREHILRAASRQFEEGDVQHWWHASSNGGVRTRISDDLLWLPFVTAQYVRVTQDLSILEERVPFLKGELLKDDQEEAYFVPEISNESASLLEHCRRAIYRGLTKGPHDLPLIGGGDWNDGMNRVGVHGKGESVWLAWFLIHVLKDFAELLTASGQPGAAEGYRAQAKRLAEHIEDKAWDGNWYIRAFTDDGTPLGSHANQEDKIDSLPQSWAVISAGADEGRAIQALKSVEEHLIREEEGLLLLLTPPFDKTALDPGYIKGYPPGVRENGGQYTHGSLWVPMALARLGEGDRAVHLLNMMHPQAHALNSDQMQRYKLEPYAVAADIYALPGHIGRGGWSWYTGSASWMYRIWLEEILGFTLRGDRLSFKPRLPSSWEEIKISYLYQTTRYEISLKNPPPSKQGTLKILLDGQSIEGNAVTLVNDGHPHRLELLLNS